MDVAIPQKLGARVRVNLRATFRLLSATSLVSLFTVLLSGVAEAHSIGLSRGDYSATAEGLAVEIVLAQAEMLAVVPSLDEGHDGSIDGQALAHANRLLDERVTSQILVSQGGAACTGHLVDASLTELDGLRLRAHYTCAAGGMEPISVRLALLDDLSHGHRHAARVTSTSGVANWLLFRGQAELQVPSLAPTLAGAPPAPQASPSHWTGFVRMGIEHILTGYDHLFFLFALVLGGGRFGSLALTITSFTIAHCLTLGLAVLGVVSPPASLVEPAIALSVAYAGAETIFRPQASRVRIAFPFGLLHGFGFAGALTEIAIPRAEVPAVLASFNLGVELGQLAWILVLSFVVGQLRRLDWFARRAIPVLAVAIVAFGLVCFADRADLWHG